jgi:hypothetical protein
MLNENNYIKILNENNNIPEVFAINVQTEDDAINIYTEAVAINIQTEEDYISIPSAIPINPINPINHNIPIEVIVGNQEAKKLNKCCRVFQFSIGLSIILYLSYYYSN